MRLKGSKRFTLSWWQLVLGIDLLMVLVTVLRKYPVFFPGRQWLVRHFNLAAEMNSSVWWSMACLLALALMAYEVFSQPDGKQKPAWLVLSVVLAGLSLDEIGSLHERTHGWNATRGIFMALLAMLVAFSVIALFRSKATKRSSLFIASAFVLFGSAAVQEYLQHHVTYPEWFLGIRSGLEEGSELLAMFLLFWGIVPHRTWVAQGSLRALVPDPSRMKNVSLLILGGGLVHSLASVIVPSLLDITQQGNPLAWYPAAVFFLLSSATYWKYQHFSTRKTIIEACLPAFFLFCSVSFAYRLPKLFHLFKSLVPDEYLPSLFLFSLVAGVLVLSSGTRGYWSLNGKYFLGLLALPPMCLLTSTPEALYFASGLLAYLVYHIFGGQCALRRAGPDNVEQNPRLI